MAKKLLVRRQIYVAGFAVSFRKNNQLFSNDRNFGRNDVNLLIMNVVVVFNLHEEELVILILLGSLMLFSFIRL